ncbi:hypothetical protein SASPL_132809 [Salvia splendens]|uniref:25S rRNA (uridine-N(3))-methyltransferase BMT5-like domain-containing protein n=1 Tax=Salvia splendens TaxID=180675 RepID=A0A8X8ZHV0_SALSN|nr:hypothetical protein SASPL_132809 [Salvia splendens]
MYRMHRDLVRGFLLNASCMLHFDGEIHIRHKSNATFDRWKIEDLGLECSLVCIAQDEFRIEEFPGYNNKRGSSSRADEPFPLGPCKTYRFRLISSWMFHLMRQMHPVPSSFASQMFPNPPPRPLVPQHQPLITTVDDHGSARGYCTCWDCRTRRDSSTKQRQMHPSASRMFPNPPPITTVGDHGAARRYYASECCCGSWDCRTSRDSSTKRHQMHSVPPFASQMFPNPPPLVQQHQPPITTVDDHGAARQYYASECLFRVVVELNIICLLLIPHFLCQFLSTVGIGYALWVFGLDREGCSGSNVSLDPRLRNIVGRGVISVSIGKDNDQLEVVGEGVDSVCLAKSLRKKFCFADILSVAEVKPEKKSPEKCQLPFCMFPPPPCQPFYERHYYDDPGNPSCCVM